VTHLLSTFQPLVMGQTQQSQVCQVIFPLSLALVWWVHIHLIVCFEKPC
jgi:hypothetical protein